VWHGHYAKYLERARCQLLDKIGYNYQAMREDGYVFPIVDMHLRYAEALKFTQKCRVETTLLEWENRLRIRYRISDAGTGRRLTTAHTVQVAVELETGKLVFDCPPTLIRRVENYSAR